jgi:hypothetical protein
MKKLIIIISILLHNCSVVNSTPSIRVTPGTPHWRIEPIRGKGPTIKIYSPFIYLETTRSIEDNMITGYKYKKKH